MSYTPSSRRRRPQEFTLPNGKKVIASLPEDLDSLREKHGNRDDVDIEIVVHGSAEHCDYLRETRNHHEGRRAQLREQHSSAFDEWEHVHSQLKSVSSELEKLTSDPNGLGANFNKFGYGAELRTYDGDTIGETASSAALDSETLSTTSAWSERRTGETTKLFKKPVVKQWFHKGLLWRASEHTEITAIELFFDLLYGRRTGSIIPGSSTYLSLSWNNPYQR